VKLLLDTLRFAAGKLAAVLLVAAVVVGFTFVASWARSQKDLQSRIDSLRLDTQTAWNDWQTNRIRALDAELRLHQLEAARPNPILHPSDYLTWRTDLKLAQTAAQAANTARDQARNLHDRLRARLDGLESQIDTTLHTLLRTALETWPAIAIAAAALLLGPIAWKAFWFYAIAPIAGRSPPIHLLPPDAPGSCQTVAHGKCIEVAVEPGNPLLTRMAWLQQYAPGLEKRTRLLFDTRFPFVSYASGLREMTEIRARPAEPANPGPNPNPNPDPNPIANTVVLTAADDPNAYLLALRLDNHPGVVLKPGVVVAVQGPIVLRSRWRLTSVHAWISGRLRHLLFAGTGTLYLSGHAGIDWQTASSPVVVEEALVLGYDARTPFATARTETFWPYLRDRTSLFDYRFPGNHAFVRQTAASTDARRHTNPLARAIDTILGTIGRLLGF